MVINEGTTHEHKHHLSSLSLCKSIWCLIVLTIITVVRDVRFCIMNIVVAMVIAVIKATLVILFHAVKFDDIGTKLAFTSAFVFLAVFIMLTA